MEKNRKKRCEVTILMPCLNEANTIEKCIGKAFRFLDENQIDGEVLVIDNDSVDNSAEIASLAGAHVFNVKEKGYGNALIRGIMEAHGKYVIMGDADESYDYLSAMPILEKLRDGYDLVIGNRFKGGIEKGAMPFLHRYIGNPVLSLIGRMLYPCAVGDYHCGMRGFQRERILELQLEAEGMEFASEMIVKAQGNKYRITEVPVKLYKDGRTTASHLRPLPDALRHLRLLFRYRPVVYSLLTFFCMFMLCAGLLICSSMIPGKLLQKNMEKSADYFVSHQTFENLLKDYNFTRVDNYADCILTDMIYCMDSEHPLSGMIKASYYHDLSENVSSSFQKIVSGEISEPNVDYFRYWHGSMTLLRVLFLFFSISEIRMALGLLLLIMVLWLLFRLWKHGFHVPAVLLIIGFLGVHVWMTAFCIEYVTTFLVMTAILLIIEYKESSAVREYKNGDDFFIRVFIVSGVLTCYVDFLTTETITFTVPLLLYYLIRYQKNKMKSFLQELKFVVKCAVAWGCSYVLMFLMKWGLSCIMLGPQAFGEAWEDAALRISGTVTVDNTNFGETVSLGRQLSGAIWRNLHTMFGLKINVNSNMVYLISAIVLMILFSIWYLKRKSNLPVSLIGISVIIALIPYVRFIMLRNHSYLHYFFTYRAQMAVIIAIGTILWYSICPEKRGQIRNKPKKGKRK